MSVVTDEHRALPRDAPRSVAARPRRHRAGLRRRLGSDGGIVFGSAAVVYLVCGSILAFHYHTFFGDAVFRMANGFYVLSAADREEAAKLASMIPATTVEVRQLMGVAGL